jgi:hypothetical protein
MSGDQPTAIGEWWVDAMSSVKVKVTDPEHIDRCFTEDWRSTFYTLATPDEVMQHLAFNCIANSVEDASRLDGWADLAPGALTMELDRLVEWERVVEPEPKGRTA